MFESGSCFSATEGTITSLEHAEDNSNYAYTQGLFSQQSLSACFGRDKRGVKHSDILNISLLPKHTHHIHR